MKGIYLEITFRKGHALAAYLYLPRQPHDTCAHSEKKESEFVVDFNEAGKPIGIEILSPKSVSHESINKLVMELGLPALPEQDIAPLFVV